MVKTRNYENGKIYKLIDPETKEVTVGSTTATLDKVLTYHERKLGKEFEIELIQDYPCNNYDELKRREIYYSGEEPVKKKRIYSEHHKQMVREYCDKHKVSRSTKAKEYYQQNKEAIIAKCLEYRNRNREKINEQKRKRAKEIPEVFKARAARYREKHRDKINTNARTYYAEHREQMRADQRARYYRKKDQSESEKLPS